MNLIVETTIKRFEFKGEEWGDWYWEDDRLVVFDPKGRCILSCAKESVILVYKSDSEYEEEHYEECCEGCCANSCSNPTHLDYQEEDKEGEELEEEEEEEVIDGYCMCPGHDCETCVIDEACLACGNYISFDAFHKVSEDAPEYRCGESLCISGCGSDCICNSSQCKYYFRCQAGKEE